MKISDKIRIIIEDVSYRNIGMLTKHNNDDFSVGLYFQTEIEDGKWYVWLTKPTQRTLDFGELFEDGVESQISEDEIRFISYASTLVEALNQLHDKVKTLSWNS